MGAARRASILSESLYNSDMSTHDLRLDLTRSPHDGGAVTVDPPIDRARSPFTSPASVTLQYVFVRESPTTPGDEERRTSQELPWRGDALRCTLHLREARLRDLLLRHGRHLCERGLPGRHDGMQPHGFLPGRGKVPHQVERRRVQRGRRFAGDRELLRRSVQRVAERRVPRRRGDILAVPKPESGERAAPVAAQSAAATGGFAAAARA